MKIKSNKVEVKNNYLKFLQIKMFIVIIIVQLKNQIKDNLINLIKKVFLIK